MAKKVLIAEDDNIIIGLIEFLLKKSGYELIIVKNGIEVFNIVNKKNPDIILMDISLHALNAIDITQELQSNPNTEKISIIYISTLGNELDVLRGLQAGAIGYIVKPFSPKELLDKVGKVAHGEPII